MRHLVAAGALVVVAGVAAPALAQSRGRYWVEARLVRELDGTWTDEVLSGHAGGIAMGLDFSDWLGAQIAVDWPAPHVNAWVDRYRDPVFGLQRVAHEETHRSRSWSTLIALHAHSTPRMRVTLLAGLASVDHESRFYARIERLGANDEVLSVSENDRPGSYQWGGLVVGAEVPVRVGSHVDIVPGVRALLFIADYGRTHILRPGVGVRWRF